MGYSTLARSIGAFIFADRSPVACRVHQYPWHSSTLCGRFPIRGSLRAIRRKLHVPEQLPSFSLPAFPSAWLRPTAERWQQKRHSPARYARPFAVFPLFIHSHRQGTSEQAEYFFQDFERNRLRIAGSIARDGPCLRPHPARLGSGFRCFLDHLRQRLRPDPVRTGWANLFIGRLAAIATDHSIALGAGDD